MKAVKGKGARCDKARAVVGWGEGGEVYVASAEVMMAVRGR